MRHRLGICSMVVGAMAMAVQPVSAQDGRALPEVLSVQRIGDRASHSAFTDLVRFKGTWFCVFREAKGHAKGNGTIRVLTSGDGEAWASCAAISEAGVDLRDPKVSVTPDARLMLTMGGSVYVDGTRVSGQSRVAFSLDGGVWSAPQPILERNEWLWRVTWHGGVAYGVAYRAPEDAEWTVRLVRSDDGIHFEHVTDLSVPGKPNETTLRFDGDTMLALVRREGESRHAWIGTSRAPFTDWTWEDSGLRFGGPNFVVLPDGTMWAAGRRYAGQRDDRRTILARMTRTTLTPVLELPSGGDTSYPGLVWHDGILWMSYYASHEGKSSIYLARIRL